MMAYDEMAVAGCLFLAWSGVWCSVIYLKWYWESIREMEQSIADRLSVVNGPGMEATMIAARKFRGHKEYDGT